MSLFLHLVIFDLSLSLLDMCEQRLVGVLLQIHKANMPITPRDPSPRHKRSKSLGDSIKVQLLLTSKPPSTVVDKGVENTRKQTQENQLRTFFAENGARQKPQATWFRPRSAGSHRRSCRHPVSPTRLSIQNPGMSKWQVSTVSWEFVARCW